MPENVKYLRTYGNTSTYDYFVEFPNYFEIWYGGRTELTKRVAKDFIDIYFEEGLSDRIVVTDLIRELL